MSTETQIELISRSPEQTHHLGGLLAGRLAGGQVVALTGHLGAGKTQWVKGLAAGLGIDPDAVHSPTFTLINEYSPEPETGGVMSTWHGHPAHDCPSRAGPPCHEPPAPRDRPKLLLYHVDVYRLGAESAAAELEEIGFSEIVAAGDGIIAVEWADRVAELIPADAVWIEGSMPSRLGPSERHYRIRSTRQDVLDALTDERRG